LIEIGSKTAEKNSALGREPKELAILSVLMYITYGNFCPSDCPILPLSLKMWEVQVY